MFPSFRQRRLLLLLSTSLVASGLLASCAWFEPSVTPVPMTRTPLAAPEPSAGMPTDPVVSKPTPVIILRSEAAITTPVRGGQPGAVQPDTTAASVALLAYADRLRRMPSTELTMELSRLGEMPEPMRQAFDDLQLALALSQTRLPSDTVRAQALVQRVLSNNRDEVRGLQPLASMLAARYADQRRLEEQIERQNQQLRDNQRRIDQLNERLEAVRTIERSLTTRPSAPANGAASRPTAP